MAHVLRLPAANPRRGIAEAAAELGVSENIVRTRLARLFAKTGTSRQADLLQLLVSVSSPLR